jgi:catechol 2,3-dioxygenase-like lactoylglutathione lyase family enzyme
MTTIAELTVHDSPEAWRRVGFAVDDSGRCQIGTVRVRISDQEGSRGVVGWVLAATPDDEVLEVDGLPTSVGDPPPAAPGDPHPDGADHIDHVVVVTPDLDRTVRAVERSLGVPLRRTRDGESGGRPVRQSFFRLGEVILEVVGSPEPDPAAEGAPAQFFGLAVSVVSLDAAVDRLGTELVSEARPAVQPGRRIATIRQAAGLAVPVALMSG